MKCKYVIQTMHALKLCNKHVQYRYAIQIYYEGMQQRCAIKICAFSLRVGGLGRLCVRCGINMQTARCSTSSRLTVTTLHDFCVWLKTKPIVVRHKK